MSTQDTAGTAREGVTMSDETTMDTSETTRLHRCAKCGGERSAVESCEGDCYPLCGPCHVELRHEDAAVWRARVDAAERERDDRAATLETTERERDEARDALRRLKSRPDERRLPCDGDARAEAAMARDAADEADPAWWRGHDAAVRGMMTVVRRALTEPPRGAYGSEEAREVDASIRALRTKLDAARREGAEGMREALIVRFTQRVEYLHPWAEAEDDENGCHSGAWTEALNAVQFTRDMVLPLDAPGSAS